MIMFKYILEWMLNNLLTQYFQCDLEDVEVKALIGNSINYTGKTKNPDLSQISQKITSNFNYFHGQGKYQNVKRFINLLELVEDKQESIFVSYIYSLLFLQQTDFLLSARILATDAYSQFILTRDEYQIIIKNILYVLKHMNENHISEYYISLCLRVYSNLLLNAHFISNKLLQNILYGQESMHTQKLMMQISIQKLHVFARQLQNKIEYTNKTIMQIRLMKQWAYYITYLFASNYLHFKRIIGLIEYANTCAEEGGFFQLFIYIATLATNASTMDVVCQIKSFINDFLFNILQYLQESDQVGQQYLSQIQHIISPYSKVVKTYTDQQSAQVNINYTKLFYQDNLFLLSNKIPYCTLIQYYAQQMHLNKVTLCTNIIEEIKYQIQYTDKNKMQYIDIYKNQLIRNDQLNKYFYMGEKVFGESCVIYQLNEEQNDITQFYVIKIIQYDENYSQVENNHIFNNYSDHNRYILLKQHQSIYIQSYQSLQNLSSIINILTYQNTMEGSQYDKINNKTTLINIVLQHKKIYEQIGNNILKYPLLSFGKITNNILNILNCTLQDSIHNKVELLNSKLIFDKDKYTLSFNSVHLTQSLNLYNNVRHLRESQFACLLHVFIKDFLVIIGAPGTGKTYTILQIIRSMLLISRATFKIMPNRPLTNEQQYFKQNHHIQYTTTYFDLIFSAKPKHQIIFVSHSNKAVNQLNKKFYPQQYPLSDPFIYRNISEEQDQKYTTYYYINKIYQEMFPEGQTGQVDQRLKAIYTHLNSIRDYRADVFANFKSLENHLIINSMLLISTTTMIDKHYQTLLYQYQQSNSPLSPIIIVEEAARISSYNLSQIIFLCPYKIILLGDFLQLPSVIKEKSLEYDINMTISLFERFAIQRPEVILLNEQYRCPSQICDLYRDIYATCLPSVLSRPLVDAPNVLGYRQNSFQDHQLSESDNSSDNETSENATLHSVLINQYLEYHQVLGSFNDEKNIEEVKYVIDLVNNNLLNQYKNTQITILTLYKKQQSVIQSQLINKKIKVNVFTVDEYQGLENDVIVFSLVSRNPSPYANDLRRSIVAVSRAKMVLHIVGDIKNYDNDVFINMKKMICSKKNSYRQRNAKVLM